MEWQSGLRRRLQRTPAPVRTRPLMAFFFGQFRVSGEKCRHPPPGHDRCPLKKSAKPKTHVFNNLKIPPLQTEKKTNS